MNGGTVVRVQVTFKSLLGDIDGCSEKIEWVTRQQVGTYRRGLFPQRCRDFSVELDGLAPDVFHYRDPNVGVQMVIGL